MKRVLLISSLLLAIVMLYSCKEEGDRFTLGIDVQSYFDQDNVQVFVDGQLLINKQLRTNPVLGVCLYEGQITTTQNEGAHEMKVVVNNTATKTENFSLHKNFYIGINYNQQTKEISFAYADQRFLYD